MSSKSMVRGVALLLLMVLATILAGCASKPAVKEYKVGAVFSLTGPTAYWGEQLKKGMDLALKELNADSTAPHVAVVYEDVEGQQQKGIAAFRKLSDVDHVSAVISCLTPITQPLRPLAASAKLPLIATVVSAQDIAAGEQWTFRDFMTQAQMTSGLTDQLAKKAKPASMAALVVDDDYGHDGAKQLQTRVEPLGVQWLGVETFKQTDTDIHAQASKLAGLKPAAVLVVGRDQSLGLALRQLREAGFKGQLYSVNCLDAAKVWQIAGDAVDGAIFASARFQPTPGSPEGKFAGDFKAAYGTDPDYVNVYGYTIMKYLGPILRQAQGDRTAVAAALGTLSTTSVRGELKMDAKHDVLTPIGVYTVNKGVKSTLE